VNDNNVKGLVSNYLHDHFSLGDTLLAKQPKGSFHLADCNNGKLLLLSAGSGITPMLAMLRAETDSAANNDITFFHSAHSERDLIAKEEIAALAKQHGQCRVEYTLTKQAPAKWSSHQGHYQGRLSKLMLTNVPALLSREVLVCGPTAFRKHAKQLLSELGLPDDQFHFESFGENKPFNNEKEISPQAVSDKGLNINFYGWDTQHKGNNQETLLEQGEAAGLMIPYSCRGGMCGCCKVKLESGDVEQLCKDGLTNLEQEQGYVLACSCIPQSDLVINKA